MIQKHDVKQGTEEWLKLREGKYTGSSAHKLLRYGRREADYTKTTSFTGNFFTDRGHLLEDEAIELYESIMGVSVERCGFITNDLYPDCGYSPDGLVGSGILIEVKCFMEKNHMKLLDRDISYNITAQTQFGVLICERPTIHLLAYNPKMELVEDKFKIMEIKSKEDIQSKFKEILL